MPPSGRSQRRIVHMGFTDHFGRSARLVTAPARRGGKGQLVEPLPEPALPRPSTTSPRRRPRTCARSWPPTPMPRPPRPARRRPRPRDARGGLQHHPPRQRQGHGAHLGRRRGRDLRDPRRRPHRRPAGRPRPPPVRRDRRLGPLAGEPALLSADQVSRPACATGGGHPGWVRSWRHRHEGSTIW